MINRRQPNLAELLAFLLANGDNSLVNELRCRALLIKLATRLSPRRFGAFRDAVRRKFG